MAGGGYRASDLIKVNADKKVATVPQFGMADSQAQNQTSAYRWLEAQALADRQRHQLAVAEFVAESRHGAPTRGGLRRPAWASWWAWRIRGARCSGLSSAIRMPLPTCMNMGTNWRR